MTTAREQSREAVNRLRSGGRVTFDQAADAASDVWEKRVDEAVEAAIVETQQTPIAVELLVRLRNKIVGV